MKDWSNITILDYYNLISIIRSENIDIELDRTVKLLAYVSGREEDEFASMPLRELQEHTKHIAFLSTGTFPGKVQEVLIVDKQKYKVCLDAFKIRAGQYIDINEFVKDPDFMVKNLHNIMAVLCLPQKPRTIIDKALNRKPQYHEYCDVPFEYVSDQMLNARYIDCYHTAGFFLKLLTGFNQTIKTYLTEKISQSGAMNKEETQRTLTNLYSVGAGQTISNQSPSTRV